MARLRSPGFWLGIALLALVTRAHAYSLIAIHDFRHLVTGNEALTDEQRQYPALVFEFEGLAFTEDGSLWASIAADPDGSSRELWKLDLQSRTVESHPHPGELLPSFPLSQYGNPVGLASMGSQLIVGHNFKSFGNLIGSFDPANPSAWNPMFSLDTATCDEVEGLAYSGGKLYASCQNDGKVLEMDPASGAVSRTFGFQNQVLGLAETGDGRLVVGTYPGDRELLIFDPSGLRPTESINIHNLFAGAGSAYHALTGELYSVQVVPSESPRTRPDPDGLAYWNGTIYMSFDGDLRVFEIATAVPELKTWTMLLTGLGLIGLVVRRRTTSRLAE